MFSISLFNPFALGTFVISIIAWIIAFAGSIATSTSGVYPKFSWWAVVFELILIIIVITLYLFQLHKVYKTFLCCMISIAFVYTSNSSNNLVYVNGSSYAAASAGFIILSMVNLLWLFYFGTDSSSPIIQYVNSFENESNNNNNNNNNNNTNFGSPLANTNTTSNSIYQDKEYNGNHNQMSLRNQELTTPNLNRPLSTNNQDTPMSNSNPFESNDSQFSQLKGFENVTTTNTSTNRFSYVPQTDSNTNSNTNTNTTNSNFNGSSEQLIQQADEDYPILVRGLYDYQASPDDINELSFKKGEFLKVKESNGNWWQGKNSKGDIGMCPSNYVEIVS